MKPAIDRSEEVRTRIAAVAAQASEADKRGVEQILTQAKVGDYQSEKATVTPAMAALLFLRHNQYNRDWKYQWSLELLRRIETEEWRPNGDTIRFYKDGQLADGQNRLGGVALGNKIMDVIIVYGLNRNAILTIDGGKPRYASDVAKLDGVENAVEKERIVKLASGYRVRMGETDATLRSEVEVNTAITRNNGDLQTALGIAEQSAEGVVTPKLKRIEAATIAYLMIQGRWPLATIKEKLALFQTGVSKQGEEDPFYVVGRLIDKSRQAVNKRDKLTTTKQLGMVVYAMLQVEKGIKAISSSRIRDAVKSNVPRADYPVDDEERQEAA